jgi:hypothetical protein
LWQSLWQPLLPGVICGGRHFAFRPFQFGIAIRLLASFISVQAQSRDFRTKFVSCGFSIGKTHTVLLLSQILGPALSACTLSASPPSR